MMIHPTIATLRRLRLTGMAKALEEQQGLPDCDRLSFDERLAKLVHREAVERDNAALAQRLRLAGLRQAAHPFPRVRSSVAFGRRPAYRIDCSLRAGIRNPNR
jgi:hypothetical protein